MGGSANFAVVKLALFLMPEKKKYNDAAMRYAMDYLDHLLELEAYVDSQVEKKLEHMIERKIAEQEHKHAHEQDHKHAQASDASQAQASDEITQASEVADT